MAFSTAITGLKASTTELDVTGNNIANASTVGFKSGRTEFADIFSTVVVGSGSANSPGSGVIVSDIAQDFTAGTIQFTNNTLDLAIDGSGFFQLNDGQGGITYTRAGGFELDKDGNVVSKNGNFLQGFGLDSAGNMQPIGNLAVDQKESPPKATEMMDLSFNIDSRAVATSLPYDPADSATFAFSTTNRSFDSLGNENTIKFDYIKQGEWRERQTVNLVDFTADLPAGALQAGDSFNLAGATLSVVAAGTEDPALGQIGDDVDETTFAAAVEAVFTATGSPLQTQVGWDNRIQEIRADAATGDLVVTYGADASDVRPIVLQHAETGSGVITNVSENTVEDPFFPANKVDNHAFTTGPIATGSNLFVEVGEVQVGVAIGMTNSDVVDEIIKSTNAILGANPEIDTLEKDSATGDLIITYKAELGDEPLVEVTMGNVNTAEIDVTSTNTEVGDNSFDGVYQMHAFFNTETALDIGRPPQPGSGLTTSEAGPILVTFDTTNGLLKTINGQPVSATGAAPSITIVGSDPANPLNTIELDMSGSTQFASDSIVKASTQDGFTKGDLIGVTFAPDGTMVASFSNGQNSNLGIVAMATFENQGGLQPVGDTAWSATLASGQAILNPPGTGLNGQLRSAALEQSNVNLSEQLVKLIEAQRNFQANSKTLQTENAITQNILQIS
ncbi:MAG: flagellar hook-basal body complex protein [Motiliproteus sp.]